MSRGAPEATPLGELFDRIAHGEISADGLPEPAIAKQEARTSSPIPDLESGDHVSPSQAAPEENCSPSPQADYRIPEPAAKPVVFHGLGPGKLFLLPVYTMAALYFVYGCIGVFQKNLADTAKAPSWLKQVSPENPGVVDPVALQDLLLSILLPFAAAILFFFTARSASVLLKGHRQRVRKANAVREWTGLTVYWLLLLTSSGYFSWAGIVSLDPLTHEGSLTQGIFLLKAWGGIVIAALFSGPIRRLTAGW